MEARDEIIERFDKLQQGSRSVDEYAFEFNQLSKIVVSRIPTERDRVQRFVKGLRIVIQRLILS